MCSNDYALCSQLVQSGRKLNKMPHFSPNTKHREKNITQTATQGVKDYQGTDWRACSLANILRVSCRPKVKNLYFLPLFMKLFLQYGWFLIFKVYIFSELNWSIFYDSVDKINTALRKYELYLSRINHNVKIISWKKKMGKNKNIYGQQSTSY